MKKLFNTTLASALLMVSAFASAVTVKDAKGEFTLDKTPSRVVALEYSFVDAFAESYDFFAGFFEYVIKD